MNPLRGRSALRVACSVEQRQTERKAAVTPSGKPTLHKLTKTERSELYRGWVFSNILATAREALAVAPKIEAVTIVVLQREAPTPCGEHPLSAVYVGTLTRDQCARIAWNTRAAVNAVLDAGDLLIQAKGQTKSLVPLDLSGRPDLASIVQQFKATLTAS